VQKETVRNCLFTVLGMSWVGSGALRGFKSGCWVTGRGGRGRNSRFAGSMTPTHALLHQAWQKVVGNKVTIWKTRREWWFQLVHVRVVDIDAIMAWSEDGLTEPCSW
jgi:hypothetical protein